MPRSVTRQAQSYFWKLVSLTIAVIVFGLVIAGAIGVLARAGVITI